MACLPARDDPLSGDELFTVTKAKHRNLSTGTGLVPTRPFECPDRTIGPLKSLALVLVDEFECRQIEPNAGFGCQTHRKPLFAAHAFDLDGTCTLDDVLVGDQGAIVDEETGAHSLRQVALTVGLEMLSGLVNNVHPYDSGRCLVFDIFPVNAVRLESQQGKQQKASTQ